MFTLYIKFSDDLPSDIQTLYNSIKDTGEDAGLDLYCPESMTVSEYEPSTINHMISCCMINEETNELTAYYLYPRSSISNYALMMTNHVGIIDKGYRGNIKAKVRRVPYSIGSYIVDKQNRLFQICAPDLSSFKVKVVDSLPDSKRGTGGFGSTGN